MIDDAVLERLLAEVADEVEVPADGAARVLAARDALTGEADDWATAATPAGRRPVGYLADHAGLVAAAAAVLVVVVAVGLGSRGGGGAVKSSSGGVALHAAPTIGASGVASSAAGATGGGAAAGGGAPAGGGAAAGGGAPAGGGATAGGGARAGAAVGAPASPGAAGLPAAPVAAGATPAPATTVPAAPGVPSAQTRTVKTGQVTLVVATGKVDAVMGQLGAEAVGLGGFVQSSSATSGVAPPPVTVAPAAPPTPPVPPAPASTLPAPANPPASGDLVLRVPVNAFESLVADVTKAGTAITVATTGQDVTGQYVDLQARIASLSAERTQYQQILGRASNIGDILSVESQLTVVQTQIEQLQGQLNVLADQSKDSTLSVHLEEPALAPPPVPGSHHPQSGVAKAWQHARSSFAHGLESILSASGGIAVGLLTIVALALVARVAYVVVRRRML